MNTDESWMKVTTKYSKSNKLDKSIFIKDKQQ